MKDPLKQKSVLVLDSGWVVTNTTTPKRAITDMAKDTVTAIVIHGKNDFEPVKWKDWVTLPVNDGDEYIATPKGKILMPKVIVAVNFQKASLHRKKPKLTTSNVGKLYGYKDCYTGKYIGKRGTTDHYIPRAKGGVNDWPNVVYASPEINQEKADKLPHEFRLPLKIPIKNVGPMLMVCAVEPRSDRPEWNYFIKLH